MDGFGGRKFWSCFVPLYVLLLAVLVLLVVHKKAQDAQPFKDTSDPGDMIVTCDSIGKDGQAQLISKTGLTFVERNVGPGGETLFVEHKRYKMTRKRIQRENGVELYANTYTLIED